MSTQDAITTEEVTLGVGRSDKVDFDSSLDCNTETDDDTKKHGSMLTIFDKVCVVWMSVPSVLSVCVLGVTMLGH